MTDTEDLERELLRDLFPLRDRLRDEWFATELYHALTNTAWRKQDGPDGHLSLSWNRAERIVNELRQREGEGPLDLARTGGEGELSDAIEDELSGLGWTAAPLNTSRHDEAHVSEPDDPPLADDEPPGWEQRAHEDADRRS